MDRGIGPGKKYLVDVMEQSLFVLTKSVHLVRMQGSLDAALAFVQIETVL